MSANLELAILAAPTMLAVAVVIVVYAYSVCAGKRREL